MTARGGNGFIDLHFRDNGVGFSTTAPVKGMGLQIMRERAEAINAQRVIKRVPGEGSDVQIGWTQQSL
ncbi:MAG: hypothetical protein LCI00_11745 [Chloroflexi bacterium]|nr:hypothetical protein [Chloroflexota bacterium]